MTEIMDRIRDEMAREAADSPISAIGEYVTERIQAGAVIAEGKTLAGAYKTMHDWASKNRGNQRCVCVPPSRAFALVDEYFGFGKKEPQAIAQVRPAADDLDLDALLGGL